jgi:hypothetical protein
MPLIKLHSCRRIIVYSVPSWQLHSIDKGVFLQGLHRRSVLSSSSCSPCPIGNYCPTSGMTSVYPCTKGSSCPSTGLTSPKTCPAGPWRRPIGGGDVYCWLVLSVDWARALPAATALPMA